MKKKQVDSNVANFSPDPKKKAQKVSKLSNVNKSPERFPIQGNRASKFSRYGYSIFAIIVFLGGVYCGAKYLPSRHFTVEHVKNKKISDIRTSIPASAPEDFFPVAEFRSQAALLIGCQNQIDLIPKLFTDIAKAIDLKVPLFGVVSTKEQAYRGSQLIKDQGLPPEAMRFLVLSSNTIWIRDYAPFILRYDNDRALMVDAKYHTRTMREKRKQDDFMGFELSQALGLPVRSIPIILEGGNFISNGDGLLLTSSKTLAVNKEGEYTHKQLISMFHDYLGVDGVFALHPLQGEPNGHLDMFMTMLAKNLAVIAEIEPSVDPENSLILDETAKFVSSITTSAGPIVVKRIPMPPKWGNSWRSYTNVIMANGVLLMPSYSDVDPVVENLAEEVFRASLPSGWQVKRINCDKLVALRGQLHCISYNIPNFISIDGLLEKAIP